MSAIAAMAIVSMLASVIIAQTATGDAAAINKAGTLRMQAYRLAEALRAGVATATIADHAATFEQTLAAPALVRRIPNDASHPLRQRYETLRQQWQNELKPAATAGEAGAQQEYLQAVPAFVGQIDAMVDSLETAAAGRIQLLRFGQGTALFVTVLVIVATLYRLTRDVTPGLRELLSVVQAAQQGDLSRRTSYRGNDEIGALAQTFNTMADNLQSLYQQLEDRVADKTARLSRSNNALQVLYDAAHRAARGADQPEDWVPIVTQIEDRLGTGPVVLTLAGSGSSAPVRIDRDGAQAERTGHLEAVTDGEDDNAPQGLYTQEDGGLCIPVTDGGDLYGVLAVRGDGSAVTDWQRQLMATVAEHIATARGRTRREAESRRLTLMEERSMIARELHDSLAQSLSYLKIQVTRLEARILPDTADTHTVSVLRDLREGLNTAYSQLREIMSTFRARMDQMSLVDALEAAVSEYQQYPQAPVIHFEAPATPIQLDANVEIHLVHIVREALANTVNHAQADNAWVQIGRVDANSMRLVVEDDGLGVPENTDRPHHYGLRIMTERARSLGGNLVLTNRSPQGTRVSVTFERATANETESPA